MQSLKNPSNVEVFFDGACHLCSREIDHYRSKDLKGAIRFVDISTPEFRAVDFKLDPIAVQKVMHVRGRDGELKLGVDAFIEIWNTLPQFSILAKVASQPWVRPFLDVGYHAFATIRPYLPKKKRAECSDGKCVI